MNELCDYPACTNEAQIEFTFAVDVIDDLGSEETSVKVCETHYDAVRDDLDLAFAWFDSILPTQAELLGWDDDEEPGWLVGA